MASISKIRYTNVIYENGNKRYNDDIFTCAGHNTAILLENGGGKTVFIQAALQAVLPHTDLGERKAKETFVLDGETAHIAIEWIIGDKPRRYGLTAVTLFMKNNELRSYKYAYEYGVEGKNDIEDLPFTKEEPTGIKRAASRAEMKEYYQKMSKENMEAQVFATTKDFHNYIEAHFKVIPEEWRSITVINGGEGSVEAFFDGCKTTADLVEKLLLPTVEQGLVGKGSEEFAGTFERQREHFNKHKQLERSISESEKIKVEIENYVESYSTYNQQVRNYEAKKEEAKAIWQLIEEKEYSVRNALSEFEEEKKEIDVERKKLEKELALIEVIEAKNDLDVAKESYQKEEHVYNSTKEKKEAKEKRRHVLKLARFQNNMSEAQSKMRLYEEQLAALDEDTEVEELKEILEENSGQIKGYFVEQLENIKKEMNHSEREKEHYLAEQAKLQSEKNKLVEKMQVLGNASSKIMGKIEHQQKQMDQIKMAMLTKGAHEDLELQNKQWQARLAAIGDNELKLRKNLRKIEEEQISLNQDMERHTQRRTDVLREISRVATELSQLEETQEEVLQAVKNALPIFYSLSSIYSKPQQVIATLEEQVEKLTREKEEALLLERRHAHFLENYASHDFFTVEPLLEIWTEKWQTQFGFLQTGTAFIESLEDKALKAKMYTRPSWAQLIVVEDGKEEVLIQLLEEQRTKMTYPVGVIGRSQAQALLEEEVAEKQHLIYPVSWGENMQAELFEARKKEAGKALEEAMTFRKQKEKSLREVDQMLEKVSDFLARYSHEKYAHLREEKDQLRSQESNLSKSIEEAKNRVIKLEQESKLASETLRKEASEKNRLQSDIEKTTEYIRFKEESQKDEEKVRDLQTQIKAEENLLNRVEEELKNLFEAIEEVKEQLNVLQSSANRMKDDILYKEVKDEKAIYSNLDIIYLRDKRQQLKESLGNKQRGRSELESLLKQTEQVYEENKRSYNQEEAESEEKIAEIPTYREEYAMEIDRLSEELKEIKRSLEAIDQVVRDAKTDFDKKEQDYQSKKESFRMQYGAMGDLMGDANKAKEQLIKDQIELLEKEKYLAKQTSSLDKELKFILENKQQMDKKDELYGYCAPEVKVGIVDESLKQEFTYDLKVRVVVNNLLESLARLKTNLEQSKQQVEDRKIGFKMFCQQEIRDSKLRNMAVQGITQKQDYEELVKWKEIIVERINHTLTILERDLLDQDQQISQFIIHLYAYLKTVAVELAEIPKKTRVNTEEGWKTIYEFVIPNWQEDSGKEKIRHHIYSLLDDIDGESFQDATGKEDLQKIKKYIKEQFKLKTLLKVVMGNETIRIRCRKVSNISDISSQKFSWETSNKWSGGEKWSKNMALYLGILNYLAEKKQNIQSEEQKISRAVILDNPFGKASSGHVLEPVFFIAKQLGFQIIALTAHSEGDFIRRYFPIVYSCKLRSTLDQRTAIFTKEQEIKKAYFMDNDPIALSILGSNQIGLF